MTLWPQSIVGRTLLVLLAGLVLVSLIAAGPQILQRSELLTTLGGWHGAERIANVIVEIETAKPRDRAAVAHDFATAGFRAGWSRTSPLPPEVLDGQGARVRDALAAFLGPIPSGKLRLKTAPYHKALTMMPRTLSDGFMIRPQMPMMGRKMMDVMRERSDHDVARAQGRDGKSLVGEKILLISYRLQDGSWVSVMTPSAPVLPLWKARFFAPSLLSLLAVILLSVWALRRSVKPLALFARAAERLGLDVNAPPMDETGPREVRRAAKAFNLMQRRLRTFVRDRTQMLAAISHDLRTPITRMRLRAEFIDDGEQRGKMLRDLDEMETMIAATLRFARDDALGEEAKKLDLAALVRGLCMDARNAGQEVACDAPQHLAFTGREVNLKRMVANLIENAVRYGERAVVSLEADKKAVILSVRDAGPGIPPDMMERVFDPFVRLEGSRSRETGGTGLGLTAVRTVAHAHGGRVELINLQEGGLDVRVHLPRSSHIDE